MTECVHHWAIEEANGPTSEGRCVKCGAVKEFHNATPENLFWVNQAGEAVSPTANRKRADARRAKGSQHYA